MNAPADLAEPRLYKLRVVDFMALADAGAFDEGSKVELIEGVLVEVNAQLSPRVFAKNELTFRFRDALLRSGSPLRALCEATVELSADTALDPDVILTSAAVSIGYIAGQTVALLIEVSDSTLSIDLNRKRTIYAAAGVPEYWVVDVNAKLVHRFADPRDGAYRAAPPIPLAGELRCLTMPDLAIDGAGIL